MILDCVELKQDFSELLPLNSKLKKRPESNSSYKCNICGKSYGCFQALGGHKRLHLSIKAKLPHTEDENSLSDSLEAKKIVSEPSNFEVSQDGKIINCVESKQDFSELLSCSGFGKFSSCSKTSFSALPSTQSKSSYDCKIRGNMFRCSQALGSHQRIHRVVREQLARKRKYTEGYKSLLEAKNIVSQPLSFEVSEEEKMLHCVESKQDFTELFSHSGFNKSSNCSKTRFSPLPSTLRSKSHSSYKCKLCGKSFGCSQALVGHKILHMSIKQKLARKKKITEYGNSLFGLTDSEASKFVSQPSSFEISQEKKILHFVESKQDFSEQLSHSSFEKV